MGEQQAVQDHFVEHLRGHDGIELAATYGSFGTAAFTDSSDVDMFFVPAAPAARGAALQVIVDDIGHDLWPLEWSRLEQVADLADPLTALLLDSTVVLGTPAARERLDGLRTRCRAALAAPARRAAAARPLLDRAAATLGRSAGDVDDLADPVSAVLTGWAFLCGAYLASGPGRLLDAGAPWLPDDLRVALTGALTAGDAGDRRESLRRAIAAADARLGAATPEATPLDAPLPPAERPAAVEGGYEELHSVLAKLQRSGATAALAAASVTQEGGAMLHMLDTGRWPATPEQARQAWRHHDLPDLSRCLSDPDAIAEAATLTAERLPALLQERGVRIRRVAKAADLRRR